MNILGYSCSSPWKQVPVTILMGKRFPLVFICLLCAFFLWVPAAATLQDLYVGAEAPDFLLEDLQGRSWTFADLKGEKLTMIIFWSTWSRNSKKILASAQKLYADYKDKGLAVVAVNVDSQQIPPAAIKAMKAMVTDLGLEYPVLVDQGLTVFHVYGVIALPSTVILDPTRTIRYELSGYPLVGSEEMIDFTVAQIEGQGPKAVAQWKGYQPDKEALRYYNMGKNALHSKRMATTAEMWFKKAAAADSRFVQPHISLGLFYVGQGLLAKASEQFDLVLQKDPENVVALCERGMLLVNDNNLAEGKILMKKAMLIEENYTPCFYYLGYTSGKEGKIEEALTMFTRALEINRMDMNIFIYKGRMYEEIGKPAEAAKSYRQALELVIYHENTQ